MQLVPTSRLVILFVVPLALAAATPFVPHLLKFVLAMDAGILALALADALSLLRNPVSLDRRLPRVLSLGRDNPVTIEVSSRSRRALKVFVKDDVPDSMTSAGLPARLSVPPRASVEIT